MNKVLKTIKLKIEGFSDFYLYTDCSMWETLLTNTKKHENKMLDILIREGVGNDFVSEFKILVKTTNPEYKCNDSDNVLCSKLLNKIKDSKFKKAIEKAIYSYFSEKTIVFYTQNDHIRIFSKTIE